MLFCFLKWNGNLLKDLDQELVAGKMNSWVHVLKRWYSYKNMELWLCIFLLLQYFQCWLQAITKTYLSLHKTLSELYKIYFDHTFNEFSSKLVSDENSHKKLNVFKNIVDFCS